MTRVTVATAPLITSAQSVRGYKERQNVAELFADTLYTYQPNRNDTVAPGDIIRTRSEGFSYEVLAAGASGDVVTAGGVKLRVLALNGALPVRAFGDVGAGGDDSAIFQAAATAARAQLVMIVDVPAGNFVVHNLNLPSGVWLRGAGYERQVGGGVRGTRLYRSSNEPILVMSGTSFLSGGPMHSNGKVSGIYFRGEDFSADICVLDAVTTAYFFDCMFARTGGRWVRMREVFDSRFTNCRFETGGSADGATAGVDMISAATGFEAVNQIHFTSCVWENFSGTAIRGRRESSSYSTNEIYFTSCKVESETSIQPLVDFQNCVGVHFNLLQLAGRGGELETPLAMMRLQSCNAISGDLHAEIFGATHAEWQAFVNVASSRNINCRLSLYGREAPWMASAISHDGANSASCVFEVLDRTVVSRGTTIPTVLTRDGDVDILARSGAEAALRMSRADASGESWSVGRVAIDGGGTTFRIFHNAEEVFRIQNDNVIRVSRSASEPAISFSRGDISGETWQVGRLVSDGGGSKFRIIHNGAVAAEVTNDNTISALGGLLVGAAFDSGRLLRMSAWRFWIDAQKRLRLFEGFPGSDTVGNVVHTNANGATGSRPASPVTGQQFFDTTLGIPIWWDGAGWVDATGTTA